MEKLLPFNIFNTSKLIHISNLKLTKTLNTITNLPYIKAINLLQLKNSKINTILLKLLHESFTNICNQYKINKNNLFILLAYVTKGPILKRMEIRAKGNSNTIKKRTSYITIGLTTELLYFNKF